MTKKSAPFDPLKIAGLMSGAAVQKARAPKPSPVDPDGDGDDDTTPEGDTDHDFAGAPKKAPKQVAAAKEQEKAKGLPVPKTGKKPPKGM